MRNSPAIAAVTEIQPGRYPQNDEIQLHRQVLKEFFQEWKIDPKAINGIFTAPTALLGEKRPEVAVHELLTEELGITPTVSES
ncbi:MAG TPA: thiolase, partial [Paenibacillaceae bacterium]|nr:thiolase [Paenibacillaceae bacterium]